MSRVDTVMKSMSPQQQSEAQEAIRTVNIDLGDVLKGIDMSTITKALILAAIGLFEQHILPKIIEKSPQLGVIIAAVIDQLEAAFK